LNKPSYEGVSQVQKSKEDSKKLQKLTDLASSKESLKDVPNEYVELQRGIFKITLVVTAITVALTALVIGVEFSTSVLVGAIFGLVYLRLLAKSIGRLGIYSASLSKVQLLVPVVLFLVVTRSPNLDLLPSLVGFLLYKPSLIMQFLLEP